MPQRGAYSAEIVNDSKPPADDPRGATAELQRGLGGAIFASVFATTTDAIVVTDLRGTIVDINPAYERMCGYSRAELLGQNPRLMKSDRHMPDFYVSMWRVLSDNGHWHGEVWDRSKEGMLFRKHLSINAVRDAEGKATHYVGVATEVSHTEHSEAEFEKLAHYDPLTELPNRVLFRDRVQQALHQARRTSRPLALLMLDLDGFRGVNNTFGHRTGDLLLAEIARRMLTCVRTSDTVARLSGDEFAVLLPEVANGEAAAFVAGKLIDTVAPAFVCEGREVVVSASVGIALHPFDGDDTDTLLRAADAAMYHVKKHGRASYHFFSQELRVKALGRVGIEQNLRRALEHDELLVHYQPQVDINTGAIVGLEALVRWPYPSTPPITPGHFIPIAEESHLVTRIDDWVLRATCRQLKKWAALGLPKTIVSVNLSARHFEQQKLAQHIANILMQEGADPRQIELELTESVALHNPDLVENTLLDLRQLGLHLSIDDFGTGYSSFSYLRKIQLDTLKIDRSFVIEINKDKQGAALVAAIMAVGRGLGLRIIAEGVETAAQLNALRAVGCDFIQGYLSARPAAPDRITELLRAGSCHLPPP